MPWTWRGVTSAVCGYRTCHPRIRHKCICVVGRGPSKHVCMFVHYQNGCNGCLYAAVLRRPTASSPTTSPTSSPTSSPLSLGQRACQPCLSKFVSLGVSGSSKLVNDWPNCSHGLKRVALLLHMPSCIAPSTGSMLRYRPRAHRCKVPSTGLQAKRHPRL